MDRREPVFDGPPSRPPTRPRRGNGAFCGARPALTPARRRSPGREAAPSLRGAARRQPRLVAALGLSGPDAWPVVDELIALTRHADPALRRVAVRGAGRIRPMLPAALEALRALAAAKDATPEAELARAALAKLDDSKKDEAPEEPATSPSGAPATAPPRRYRIVGVPDGQHLNVRSSPGLASSAIIADQLKPGHAGLTDAGEPSQGDWIRVRYDGKSGWVHRKFLAPE